MHYIKKYSLLILFLGAIFVCLGYIRTTHLNNVAREEQKKSIELQVKDIPYSFLVAEKHFLHNNIHAHLVRHGNMVAINKSVYNGIDHIVMVSVNIPLRLECSPHVGVMVRLGTGEHEESVSLYKNRDLPFHPHSVAGRELVSILCQYTGRLLTNLLDKETRSCNSIGLPPSTQAAF